MNSELRKFLFRLGIGSLILLMIASPLLWFNIIMDPYGVFLDHYEFSSVAVNRRLTKLKYHLNHPDQYSAFIFGSSRVNFINPEKIPDASYFNMHCPSGRPKDNLRDLRMMIKAGVKVNKVIIGIDFLSLFNDPEIAETDLLHLPYPSSLKEHYNFYKNFLGNIPTRELIIKTIDATAREREAKLGDGQFSVYPMELEIDTNPAGHIRDQNFRIPFSFYSNPQIYSGGLKHLKELIGFLKTQNIDYLIFTNPTHVTTYLNLNLDAYLNCLKDVAEISDFIDFSGLNSIAINSMNYYESSHYREKCGDLIINRIMNRTDSLIPDDFGFHVTKDNVDKQIDRHHAWLSDFFQAVRIDQPEWLTLDITSTEIRPIRKKVMRPKLNGLFTGALADTTLITVPYLRISVNQNLTSKQLPVIILDKKTIIYNPNTDMFMGSGQFADSYKNEYYEWMIPVHLIREGIHLLSAGILNIDAKTIEQSIEEVRINVIHDNLFRIKSDDKNTRIDFHVSQLNGRPADPDNFTISSRYVHLMGYAVDRQTFRPLENLAVNVNNHIYPIRIIKENDELNNIYNTGNAINCGWIGVFPMPDTESEVKVIPGRIIQGKFSPLDRKFILKRQLLTDTSVLKGLKRFQSGTDFHIDMINGQIPDKKRISIKDNNLTISGWAVDHLARQPAGSVYVRIGDRMFLADNGYPRQDVADAYKTPSYSRSGWSVEIPASLFGKEWLPMSIVILTHDKTGYFTDTQGLIILFH